MTLSLSGELRLPIGACPTAPDGGEVIFSPVEWDHPGHIRLTIRAYGAPGHFGDPSAPTKDYSAILPLSVLRTVLDHFSSDVRNQPPEQV